MLAAAFQTLHSFTGSASDGQDPQADLTLVGSTLYGTTNDGGSAGEGTLFAINPDGTGFQVLHSFTGGASDGGHPLAGLTRVGSTLYGTTAEGGSAGDGTLFAINIDGTGFQVLHSFTGSASDGGHPLAGLTLVGSTLWGSTAFGGSDGDGTLFAIDTNGSDFQVLHSFTGTASDGDLPVAGLTLVGSTLFGTTHSGGSANEGTLFAIGTSGSGFQILHSFTGTASDGNDPQADLTLVGSTLWGTTAFGGSDGEGTLFSINTSGSGFQILHSFTGTASDGQDPQADLTLVGSTLFGTTIAGGSAGDGTLFSIGTSGSGFQILHSFTNTASDGDSPQAGVTLVGSALFGTTSAGGSAGEGTLFSIPTATPVLSGTPSVTPNPAATPENTPLSGLVIAAATADAAAVTNFQITAISGGTLALNAADGGTQINTGQFITAAQGTDGLTFTPTTNSLASGGFTVQESTNATLAGLGGSTATATIAIDAAAQTVDLTSHFNLLGITADGQTFSGGLDGRGNALSANLLGSSLNAGGVSFNLGAAGAPNVVQALGQTLALPAGSFSKLVLLATDANGNQPNQTLVVHYTDGNSQTFTQSFSDWFTPQNYAGESLALALAYRNQSNGTQDHRTFNLYTYSLTLDTSKTVASITLPDNPHVDLLAISLVDWVDPPTGLQTLHSFTGSASDGQDPQSDLTLVGSTLYGTTNDGGSAGEGTLFAINPDGTGFQVLHSFTGGASDGGHPLAGLTRVGSTLYGTTAEGGSAGDGTLFAINIDGTGFQVLHSFTGSASDGGHPLAGLTLVGSTLWGSTAFGGSDGDGTLFAIDTNGSDFQVLHSFTGTASDGDLPVAGLTLVGSTLFGTTHSGGSANEGTLFAIGTSGSGFQILHSFTGTASDGNDPQADLTLVGSTLWGTTAFGGSDGEGTLFSINTSGSGFQILHSFTGTASDGQDPQADLTLVGSTLFGTTIAGGSAGDGTLFSIGTSGSGFQILHSFTNTASDGDSPQAGVTLVGSALFGTTSAGGSAGEGTLFSIPTATPVLSGTPSVTPNPAATPENTPLSGLVIAAATTDAAAVTNFQITTISGGTLALNAADGGTQINTGQFITAAQGTDGLTFTPTTNSLASGGFTVQESTNATLAGLGGSTATATIAIDAAAQTVDLTSHFNLLGITADGQTFSGGLDGRGNALSANLLGSSLNAGGVSFNLGAAGAPNVVQALGQTLALPAGSFSKLVLLATDANGNQPNQTLVVHYTDGNSQTFTQSFSDWFTPQNYAGESLALALAYRNQSNGTQDHRTFNLYTYSLTLDTSKTVASITLPDNPHVDLLAISLVDWVDPPTGLQTLHSFTGSASDGQDPQSDLTLVGSTLYGTTNDGGSAGEGTLFAINPDGTGFQVLHSFTGGASDGGHPLAGLTRVGSTLYGTTAEGGSAGDGTLFAINIDGTGFQVLHSFTGSASDGGHPLAGLTLVGSTLWGSTAFGGSDGDGTLFAIDTNGSDFQVLHSFTGTASDGDLPVAGLTLVGSTLFGTTHSGGSANEGTLFAIGTSGSGFQILHSFTGTASDGNDPQADLTLVGSTLWGTTAFGGSDGEGTLFSINTSGSGFQILHSFTGTASDGQDPQADLTLVGSTLFGTTIAGGSAGDGTLFSIGTSGSGFQILHSFTNTASDGDSPQAGVTLVGSALFGTTSAGGSAGEGTLFSIPTATPVLSGTPSVTPNPAATPENTPLSGLVIAAATADAAAVTNFQITAISGGTLALNAADGGTQINTGQFITAAQGTDGLTFTPTTNSLASGGFTVQESTNATLAGLGGSTATATIAIDAAAQTVDLTSHFNLLGITADGQTFSGGLDGRGNALSANLLGSSLNAGGVSFNLGAAGAPNVVQALGQTLALPAGSFSKLVLLATDANGNQPNQTLVVHYTDGNSQTFTQSFSDWFTPQNYAGESLALALAYRNQSNGTQDHRTFNLYTYSLTLDTSKTVASITLPDNPHVDLLAISAVI